MKKLIALLMVIFTIGTLAACNESSEDTKPSNAVSSITGGGDFDAGNNYN